MNKDEKIRILTQLRKAYEFNHGVHLDLNGLRNIEDGYEEINRYNIMNSTLPIQFKIREAMGDKDFENDDGTSARKERWIVQDNEDGETKDRVVANRNPNRNPNHKYRSIF